MFTNVQKLLNGSLAIFVCILLGGCFKSAPKPNPQMEDTILPIPESEETVVVEELPETEMDSFMEGNYAENEVAAKIFFAFDSDRLSERDRSMLAPVAEQLKVDNEKSVYIFGHTDRFGSETYNDHLSMRRNQSVANYLELMGVKAERIHCIALGNRYATPDLSKADALKDRRCDVVIH